jgi:PPK2 family polyphosphate:nucleotide phosphotransferase
VRAAAFASTIGPRSVSGSSGSPRRSARRRDEPVGEVVEDVVVDEDPLDADADLAGVAEGANRDPADGPVEVGAPVDDRPGVAAELEHDPLLAGARLHRPAHRGRSGEREHREAVVRDEPVPERAAHREDAHRAGRRPGLLHDLRDGEHREGVLGRRLEDDRASRGDRRGQLVGGEVEREVERADRGNRAGRVSPRDPDASLAAGHQVERDDLPAQPLRLLGTQPEGERRAIHLDERVPDRLAGLERDQPAQLLAARADAAADVAERGRALVGGQPAGHLERDDRRPDGLLVLLGRRLVGEAGGLAGTGRVGDRHEVRRVHPAPGQEDPVRDEVRGGGHGRLLRIAPDGTRPAIERILARTSGHSQDGHSWDGARASPPQRGPAGATTDTQEEDMAPKRADRNGFQALLRVEPGAKVDLARFDCGATFGREKSAATDELANVLARLTDLQERLWAEAARAVLVVIQGIDAAGKDGTIRVIAGAFNPQGTPVASFKAPTPLELAHDYLWRVHQRVPAKGEIGIFNRSHYEDVLIVRVHGLVPEKRWRRRYEHIRSFEKMLTDEGVTVVKFLLAIDRDEQRARLQDRVDDPTKRWKFNPGDLAERARWDDYRAAFEEMLEETSTAYAPWYLVPANRNWLRNLAVGEILADTVDALKPAYPATAPGVEGTTVE